MHVVLWTAAGHRYATQTGQIVEVIPPVEARPVPESPAWLRGSINYRGQLIPLFDVPRLLGYEAWQMRMASRILVVATQREEDGNRLAALLVQAVLGGDELEFTDAPTVGSQSSPHGEFLGPMALTDAGAVQLTHPDRITWET